MLLATQQPINWKILINTRLYLIIAVLSVLIMVLLAAIVLFPQFQTARELYAQVETEQANLDKLDMKLAELENIQFVPEFTQADLVKAVLPSHTPLLELLTSLNRVALATGITIQDFRLSPGLISTESGQLQTGAAARRSAGVSDLEVSMRLSGNYNSMQEFLLLVEKVTPFTTITRLTLSSAFSESGASGASGGTGAGGAGGSAADFDGNLRSISANLTTKTYYFTQPISVTIDSPLPTITARDQEVLAELAAFEQIDLPTQTGVMGGGVENLFEIEFNARQEMEMEGPVQIQ